MIGRNKIFGDGIGDDGVDDRFSFSVEEFRLIDVFILASPVRSSDSDIFLTLWRRPLFREECRRSRIEVGLSI